MTYPSAPFDAVGRRRFFWARNHRLQSPFAEPLSEAQLDAREVAFQESRLEQLARMEQVRRATQR